MIKSVSTPRLATNDVGVEPFATRFLTPMDLTNISHFVDDSTDRSISTRLISPIARRLSKFIPRTCAPNVLTAMSLIAILHAFHTTYNYREVWPRFSIITSIIMFICYLTLDAIDGRHAANIRNETPLGFVFNTALDAVSVNFIILTMGLSLGVVDMNLMWYLVQIGNLVFLWAQLSAFVKGFISFGLFSGPGEALFVFCVILGVRAVFGLTWLLSVFSVFIKNGISPILSFFHPNTYYYLDSNDPIGFATLMIHTIYYLLVLTLTMRCIFIPSKHNYTKITLLFCLFNRCIPSLMIKYGIQTGVLTIQDVICDGLFMAILTTELVLARMAKRELHSWLFFMVILSTLNRFASVLMAIFYFSSVFYDISTFMNIPLFTTVVNVYIDGVFDLCHIGHKRHISRALNYGNRLLVGVMSDEDTGSYKRKPIMTLDERVAEVEALRSVYKVIPGAPCFGIPKDFLEKWNIHVVLCSPEYDNDEDTSYKIPRDMGILKVFNLYI